MSQIICQQHKANKDFIICLEPKCQTDSLACISCVIRNHKHQHHNFVLIEHLLKNNKEEQMIMFHNQAVKMMDRGEHMDSILQKFDQKMTNLLNARVKQINQMMNLMMDSSYKMIEDLKKQLATMLDPQNVRNADQIIKDIQLLVTGDSFQRNQQQIILDINNCNQAVQKSQNLNKMIEQFTDFQQNTINKINTIFQDHSSKEQEMFQAMVRSINQNDDQNIKHSNNFRQLQLDKLEKLNKFKNYVQQCEKDYQPYQVFLDFNQSTSIDEKIEIIDSLDQMHLCGKVARLELDIQNNNPVDANLLKIIQDKLTNIQSLRIIYKLDQIDVDVMIKFQQMVQELELYRFELWFGGKLKDQQSSFVVIKKFNNLIQEQQNLKIIRYYHEMVEKQSDSIEGTRQVINEVRNM